MAACLAYFPGVDRSAGGYEGLIAAQDCLPTNEIRDEFAADYGVLSKLWEALSPDPLLGEYEVDYRWLSQVYVSVQPTSGQGRLLWHALGAKTLELIHENIHVDTVRDDLDTLVLDEGLLEVVLRGPDSGKKGKEIEIKIARRLRKHMGDPRFRALSERLEDLRVRHQQGIIHSVEFLKMLLAIARDLVETERAIPAALEEDRGKAALTELFQEVKTEGTPVIVERVVADIDDIVRLVRFPGWQQTSAGERQVKQALRKTLLKYQLHREQELFDRAYKYIEMYY
jgi:type I restriction enzyme R subunit